MFGNLGMSELLFILVIALIIFGPRKLPQLGRSLGETLAQFRRASEDFKRSWEREITIEEKRLGAAASSSSPSSTEKEAAGHSQNDQTGQPPIGPAPESKS